MQIICALQKNVCCTYGAQLKHALHFLALLHKKYFYLKTLLFLGPYSFYMIAFRVN